LTIQIRTLPKISEKELPQIIWGFLLNEIRKNNCSNCEKEKAIIFKDHPPEHLKYPICAYEDCVHQIWCSVFKKLKKDRKFLKDNISDIRLIRDYIIHRAIYIWSL